MFKLLESEVLVLNKGWTWVGMTTVREALVKLYASQFEDEEKSLIVDGDYITHDWNSWINQPIDDGFISTGSLKVPVPVIILMTGYSGMPSSESRWTRRAVLKRDRYTCQYCGAQPGTSELTIDHIMPKSRGGRDEWINTVACCEECNARKANRTPKEAGIKLRKPPGAPNEELRARAAEGGIRKEWVPFISKRK